MITKVHTDKPFDYNFHFNTENGHSIRYGKTLKDDPLYSPVGAEILDIEVSEICHQGEICKFCYKSNMTTGHNMSFETFKDIIDKMNMIHQCALGIGDIDGNPDLEKMLAYCKEKNIVPNITINGFRMTDKYYDMLAKYCGAVAVSNYNRDVCYTAVRELQKRGMKQVNIHQVLAQETNNNIYSLLDDVKLDIIKPNAIVFLSLKKRGRGVGYNRISDERFSNIINICFAWKIPFGFDSCSAARFLKVIETRNDCEAIEKNVEKCESCLFSSYVNSHGVFSPCSFVEGLKYDIDITQSLDFLKDVWYNSKTIEWRELLLKNNRSCPIYDV